MPEGIKGSQREIRTNGTPISLLMWISCSELSRDNCQQFFTDITNIKDQNTIRKHLCGRIFTRERRL